MCSTEMTEAAYTMSPSSGAGSCAGAAGCLGSPSQPPPPQRQTAAPEPEEDDEISVGCPSPLPLVVGASPSEAPRRLEDYRERVCGFPATEPPAVVAAAPVADEEEFEEDEEPDEEEEEAGYARPREEEEAPRPPGRRRLSEQPLESARSGSDETALLDAQDEDEDEEEHRQQLERRQRSRSSANGAGADDYFRPLKRLKMVQPQPHSGSDEDEESRERDGSERGVKSFSILDILSHRPKAKIVRPWDTAESGLAHQTSRHPLGHPQLHQPHPHPQPAHPQAQQPPAHHHHQHHHQHHHHHPQLHHPGSRELSLMGMSLASISSSMSEPPLSSSSSSGRSSVSDSGSPDPLLHHHGVQQQQQHAGLHSGIHHPALQQQSQQQQQFKRKSGSQQQQHAAQAGHNGKRTPGQGSPLDALFQMTSKTFDAGEHSQEQANHLNLFNNRQQPKKKRKSRTAFTNQQIFELEKRFLYQKYLSPADRDEIAAQLGLSNAQVITWFQNRRAKLKRDMEELKKDVQTVNPLLVAQHHKTFLENVQDLGILKKRPLPTSIDDKP